MGQHLGTRALYLLRGILAVLLILGLSGAATAAQIDVLMLYDDYSASRMRGEPAVFAKSWQDQINTMYKNSGVDLQLNISCVERYNAPGGSMNAVVTSNQRSSEVAQIRQRCNADFVTQIHKTGNCGIGFQAVDGRYAFNVIGVSCGPAAMAHELGHNMGLAHSRAQGNRSGTLYRYGLGHGVTGAFGTIMTYEWYYRARKISVFSNPNKQCRGYPCGVPEGQSNEADAVKAINNVKTTLANYNKNASVYPGCGR